MYALPRRSRTLVPMEPRRVGEQPFNLPVHMDYLAANWERLQSLIKSLSEDRISGTVIRVRCEKIRWLCRNILGPQLPLDELVYNGMSGSYLYELIEYFSTINKVPFTVERLRSIYTLSTIILNEDYR